MVLGDKIEVGAGLEIRVFRRMLFKIKLIDFRIGGIPMAFLLFAGLILLGPIAVVLLVHATDRLFPNFFRSMKKLLNWIVCGVGFLMPLALFMIWAATNDIYLDYLSTPLFSRYKTALPGWYVWDVHSCHGEWTVFGIGFFVVILFSLLLFARFIVSWAVFFAGDEEMRFLNGECDNPSRTA